MKELVSQHARFAGMLLGAAICWQPMVSAAAEGLPGCQDVIGSCVSGSAAGLDVKVDAVLGIGVRVGPLPYVELAPEGGLVTEEAVAVKIPEVLTSGTLFATSVGSINGATGEASSTSISEVEGLSLLGLVKADVLTAMCTATADETGVSVDTAGTSVLNLVVFGRKFTAVPPPNTVVPLLLGKAVVNEQTPVLQGGKVVGMSVTLVHVYLNAIAAKTEVKVASADCGAIFASLDGVLDDFFTGGFKLGPDVDKTLVTGSLHVGRKFELPRGHLEYHDHGKGLIYRSTGITAYGVLGHCANFSGYVQENGAGHFPFEATACDEGEPSNGHDTMALRVMDEDLNVIYQRGDVDFGTGELLSGGNIQQH